MSSQTPIASLVLAFLIYDSNKLTTSDKQHKIPSNNGGFMVDMSNQLDPVWRRLDEHSSKLGEHDKSIAIHSNKIAELEKSQQNSCQIMTETRQEVVTMIKTLTETVSAMQIEQAKEQGRQEQNKRWTYLLFGIASILPTASIIIFAMNGK